MKMSKQTLLLSTTLIALTAVSSQPVFAQSSDAPEIDEIMVTGSRISSANIVASSPVTTLDNTAFERTGAIDAVDVLNALPSVTAAQDSNVSNGATGTSSLNLRGLGTTRNLILVDGKRLGPGRPNVASADLNQVPTPLLERVEVVTGGASAAYGSDAIAGVANFILRRDFEGFELNTNFGFFVDSNSNGFAQEVTDLSSTDGVTPSRTEVDGFTTDVSAVFGTNFDHDRGNITGYVRYVDQKAVLQGDRDVSRCAIIDFGPVAGDDVFCVGSNFGPFPTTLALPTILETDVNGDTVQFLTNADGDFIDAAGMVVDRFSAIVAPAGTAPELQRARQALGTTAGTISLDASGNFALGADGNGQGSSNAFNFNPTNFFQRPTQRIQGGFLANYEINSNAEVYLDASFFRNTTDAQVAPSATFGEIQQINCDNPFLTPALLEAICTSNGFSGTDLANVQVNRRFVEAGGRNSLIELDNLRLVGGIRGEIAQSGWDYDIFGQYSTTSQTDTNTNDGDINLLQEALLVREGANGPECTSGRAECLPLNLLGTTSVDEVALAAILTPTILAGETEQIVIGGTVQGEIAEFSSPWSESGLSVLAGVEYRKDDLRGQPDSILIRGGSTGLGGPSRPTDASAEVHEIFAEVGVPLAEGLPFTENLSATGQFRYSEYDYQNNLPGVEEADGVSTTAYSAGLSWTPINDIRLRGQYQRAVRAPNVFELFLPQGIGLFNDSDPCSGGVGSDNLTATRDACARTGLQPALFGAVIADAGQLNELTGGNLSLQPETSDTFTLGAVVQPSIAPGLVLSVDYFDITVDDFITGIPAASILDGCLDNSQPQFCDLINRDTNGTLQNDGFISAISQNVAERVSKGFDLAASYKFDLSDIGLGNHGGVGLNYISTIYTALEQTSFPGADVDDCRGFYGGSCFTGDITPKYGHNASLTWDTNHNVSTTLSWRHVGEVRSQGDEVPEGGIGNVFEAENYLDLFATWDAAESLSFNAGINNLTDNDPPISDFRFTANGNTFPSTYDSAGRYIFVGAKLKL